MSDYFNLYPQAGQDSEFGEDPSAQGATPERFLNLGPATPIGSPSEPPAAFSSPQGQIDTEIQISNTFHFHATLDPAPPNAIFASADNIFFAVHRHRLLARSVNNFAGYFDHAAHPTREAPATFVVPEPSDVLNVLLHAVYDVSVDTYAPSFDCLLAAVDALKRYGLLPLDRIISRGTPLFNTILNRAIAHPIETYALAAADGLEDLAVAASAYTLHVRLYHAPQELIDKMGTRYMQRLYALHGTRMDVLRELLDKKLFPHVAKPHCSVEKRQVVSRALQLAGTQVMYNATPATTRVGIESVMCGIVDSVNCPDCKIAVAAHIKDIVTQWMISKRTI